MDMNLSKPQETVKDRKPGMLQSIGSQSQTQLLNWTPSVQDLSVDTFKHSSLRNRLGEAPPEFYFFEGIFWGDWVGKGLFVMGEILMSELIH